MSESLLVFAKEPLIGKVKTRLCPPFAPEEAALLAGAFLEDLLLQLDTIGASPAAVALPHVSSAGRMRERYGKERRYLSQGPGDLGQRLASVSAAEFAQGADHVLIFGSDHPNLPRTFIETLMSTVRRSQFAWIRTDDGGYAAIAMPYSEPDLFRDIPWSTPDVAETTLTRARELGIELDTVGTWYDIDRAEDLLRLYEEGVRSGYPTKTMELLSLWRADLEARGILAAEKDTGGS